MMSDSDSDNDNYNYNDSDSEIEKEYIPQIATKKNTIKQPQINNQKCEACNIAVNAKMLIIDSTIFEKICVHCYYKMLCVDPMSDSDHTTLNKTIVNIQIYMETYSVDHIPPINGCDENCYLCMYKNGITFDNKKNNVQNTSVPEHTVNINIKKDGFRIPFELVL
jgi:hypothetical protein